MDWDQLNYLPIHFNIFIARLVRAKQEQELGVWTKLEFTLLEIVICCIVSSKIRKSHFHSRGTFHFSHSRIVQCALSTLSTKSNATCEHIFSIHSRTIGWKELKSKCVGQQFNTYRQFPFRRIVAPYGMMVHLLILHSWICPICLVQLLSIIHDWHSIASAAPNKVKIFDVKRKTMPSTGSIIGVGVCRVISDSESENGWRWASSGPTEKSMWNRRKGEN